MLKPDPVAHANALVAKGRVKEALDYSAGIAESLMKALNDLGYFRIKLHARLFEEAAQSDNLAEATTHYQAIESLLKHSKLPDPAVNARYFRATYATRTRPLPVERKHRHMTLVEQLRSVFRLKGEIAECGCFRGLSSWMICATLDEEAGGFDGTGYHIFDSFAGLSAPDPEDALSAETEDRERLSDMMRPGMFSCAEADVRRHLAAFPGIAYHPGWLPQSLVGEPERSYRFIHIDVDLYAPTLGVLAYFYPRLVPGGIMLTDDYGWPGARQAFDQFCAQHGTRVEDLGGNQALIRKTR